MIDDEHNTYFNENNIICEDRNISLLLKEFVDKVHSIAVQNEFFIN